MTRDFDLHLDVGLRHLGPVEHHLDTLFDPPCSLRLCKSDRQQNLADQRIGEMQDQALVLAAPRGGVLSDMALTKFLRDQAAVSDVKGRAATARGFRSC